MALALSGAAHAEASYERVDTPIAFERHHDELPPGLRLPRAGASLAPAQFVELQLKHRQHDDGVADLRGADEIVLDVDGNVLLARGDARLMQPVRVAFQDAAAAPRGVAAGFGQPRGFAGTVTSDAAPLLYSEFVDGSSVSAQPVQFDPTTGEAVVGRRRAANKAAASRLRGFRRNSDAAVRLDRTGTPYTPYLGASGGISAAERAVLVNLYNSTNGASWTNRTNWVGASGAIGASGTECTWYGVTCDAGQNHVVQIDLAGNNLSGSLPSIAALSALQNFYVNNNFLTGSMPSPSGLTALLHFDIGQNYLTGSIPSLTGLPALQQFDVGDNQLTGSIPSLSSLTALQQFDVYNNQLTGPIPSLSGLTALRELEIGLNQLTGPIPSLAGLNSLQYILANDNKLSGPMPQPPPSLAAGQSTLCGNMLSSSGSSAIDTAWNAATGMNWIACQLGPPTCTLTATPPSIAAGSSTTLTATCAPVPTQYAWSPNTGFGSGIASGSVSPPTTTTYTVTGSNGAGAGNTASVTVTVSGGAPVCNIVASRGSVTAGTPVTLTAVCSPAATSFRWTGGTCAGISTSICTTVPAVTTTYTVAGLANGGQGPTASAVVTVTAQAFPIQSTTTTTPTTTTTTTQFQPAPADTGQTRSIFVFAHAPQSLLAKVAAKHGLPGVPARELDGSDLCVLAQADANGVLHGVTPQTMQAYLTTILQAQGQTVQVLRGVPTPEVAGASFFVGYGATAPTMIANGTYQGVVTVVNGQVVCTAAIDAPAAPHIPDELTGLWWNANESGWGIHFTQRRNVIFAAWYTYDAAGNPKWYVSTCNMPGSQAAITGTCNGTLYEVSGPRFFGAAFDPVQAHTVNVGDLQVTFNSALFASMTYHVGTQTRTVALARQTLSTGSTPPAVNNSDIWWNATESGWGMAMAQQFGVNFLAWYVYDSSGKPTWLVSTCIMSGSSCNGKVFRTTGPPLGPTFNPNAVQAAEAGTITVNFQDGNNAVVNYTIDGISATKMITRQLFAGS